MRRCRPDRRGGWLNKAVQQLEDALCRAHLAGGYQPRGAAGRSAQSRRLSDHGRQDRGPQWLRSVPDQDRHAWDERRQERPWVAAEDLHCTLVAGWATDRGIVVDLVGWSASRCPRCASGTGSSRASSTSGRSSSSSTAPRRLFTMRTATPAAWPSRSSRSRRG